MMWKVYCGLTDFSVPVEADTEEEAVRIGRETIIRMVTECDIFFARAVPQTETPGEPK